VQSKNPEEAIKFITAKVIVDGDIKNLSEAKIFEVQVPDLIEAQI